MAVERLRGYKEVGDSCEKINEPTHGYLRVSSYGPGWECERGYQALDEQCREIVIPENGHRRL